MDSTEMFDWNKFTTEESVAYLKSKYEFSSSGEAKCIFNLIEFYEQTISENTVALGSVSQSVCDKHDWQLIAPSSSRCRKCGAT